MEIIDIIDYSGKSKKKLERLRSRCIGTDGKAKKTIESMTDTDISIYGKTICIIGKFNNVEVARGAMESLLKGAPHGHAYRFITKQKDKWKEI